METDADIFRVEVHTSKIRSSVVRIAITKKSDFSDKRYMFRRFQRKSRTQSQPETGITVTGSNPNRPIDKQSHNTRLIKRIASIRSKLETVIIIVMRITDFTPHGPGQSNDIPLPVRSGKQTIFTTDCKTTANIHLLCTDRANRHKGNHA